MYEAERDRWRNDCEQRGISWARANLGNLDAGIQVHIKEWIDEYERKETAEEVAEQRRLAKEAIDAARISADTSRDSAKASQRSAFWTMWAAIAAAASALIPLLQAYGWLPKP